MSKGKQRISTDGGRDLALDNPFAGLDGAGLRSVPEASIPESVPAARKATRETLLLRRLKAGKGGKVVTEISGFVSASNLRLLLKELQRELATGGALKDKVMEIQGDRLDDVRALLEARGFRVKGS